jgi:hypothetical protein
MDVGDSVTVCVEILKNGKFCSHYCPFNSRGGFCFLFQESNENYMRCFKCLIAEEHSPSKETKSGE